MVAVINYGVGNLTSIRNMFNRIGVQAVISSDAAEIGRADRILLPGVGHFDSCMRNFNESGLRPIVEKKAFEEKVPVLGICVGAQMMTRGSEEGVEKGLGWVGADTVRFKLEDQPEYKVPNMGWNELIISADTCPLWTDMYPDPRFYFAHSFHFMFDSPELVTAEAVYGYRYPVAFQMDNLLATQFHPEKSHKFGMRVLENFAKIAR